MKPDNRQSITTNEIAFTKKYTLKPCAKGMDESEPLMDISHLLRFRPDIRDQTYFI